MVGGSALELTVAWSDSSTGRCTAKRTGAWQDMQAIYSALSRASVTQKYSFIASWISREVRWKKAGLPA
jgi:hypothetical protein